ncbi:transposase, partial [Vibrio sp. 10N.222.55.C6]
GDEKYFEEALERFLTSTRPSYAKAYEFYSDSIILANETIVEGKISKLTYEGFKKRLKSLPPYMVAVGRYGQYFADLWFRYFDAHEPPTRVLQRVEIDHTPLDVILIDDELLVPLGRPYLTLLVDVFSGCIIGYHIGFK